MKVLYRALNREQEVDMESREALTCIGGADQFSCDNSERDLPDPFSNSQVKPLSADANAANSSSCTLCGVIASANSNSNVSGSS